MPSKSNGQWRKDTLGPAVERSPDRQKTFQTDGLLTIDTLYCPEDLVEAGLKVTIETPWSPRRVF